LPKTSFDTLHFGWILWKVDAQQEKQIGEKGNQIGRWTENYLCEEIGATSWFGIKKPKGAFLLLSKKTVNSNYYYGAKKRLGFAKV